jgi:FAD/FMN-containing dehydrogenase
MKRREFLGSALAASAMAPFTFARADGVDLPAITITGDETVLKVAEIRELQESLRGTVLLASDAGYEQARKIWNAMFDRRPALIARCRGGADVVKAVQFARSHNLLTAVRGGGHSIGGKSVCEGGLVIDLSLIRDVEVNPTLKTARVGGGALLGDLDREAQAFGLATNAGVVSHTGVGGLTLGGGLGRLQRKFGLTIDNLLGVELITADGQFVTANADENADLYWGVRGGGGNFGIVTSFHFQLHTFGPEVLNFSFAYPLDQARDVLNFLFEFAAAAPEQLFVSGGLSMSPDGKGAARIGGNVYPPFDQADRLLAPLRKLGKPLSERRTMTTYVATQSAADRAAAHGKLHYAKAGFLTDIRPGLVDAVVDNLEPAPGRNNGASFFPMDGAVHQVGEGDTAYAQRDALFSLDLSNAWTDPELSEQYVQRGRDYWAEVAPHIGGGFYVNSLIDRSQQRVQSNYRGNYDRLVALKNQYDPANFLRLNANIKPTV